MIQKIKTALKGFFVRVWHVVTRLEAFIKTAAAAAVGGGVAAVGDAIRESFAAGHWLVSVEHLLALKAQFITGALVAFWAYLCNFPAVKAQAQQMKMGLAGAAGNAPTNGPGVPK